MNNSPLIKQRNCSFELLRIVAMFLIVAHHLSIHSLIFIGPEFVTRDFLLENSLYPKYFFLQFLSFGGKGGVDIFILITGYFLIKSVPKISSLLKLYFNIVLYSLLFYVLVHHFSIDLVHQLNIKVLTSFIPFKGDGYWFFACYFLLVFIAPFLNIALRALTKNQYKCLLAIFLVLWSVIPVLTCTDIVYFHIFGWFVLSYAVAAYVRLHCADRYVSNRVWIAVFFVSIALLSLYVVYLNTGNDMFKWFAIVRANSILIFMPSFALFMIARNLNIPYNKWISLGGATTLGIYLIHDNQLVRNLLWTKIFHVRKHFLDMDIIHFAAYSSYVICTVFFVCVVIEYIRMKLLSRLYKYIDRVCLSLDYKVQVFFTPKTK